MFFFVVLSSVHHEMFASTRTTRNEICANAYEMRESL